MSAQAGSTRRRLGPVDIAFIVAFGTIGAIQILALIAPSPGLEVAADISRYALLPVALLQIGVVLSRPRRDRADTGP